MNSTIFDFRIALEDGNILKYITESIYIGIESDSRVILVSDVKDFAIKSQFSLLANGQAASSYLTIGEYCSDSKECLIQTLYSGFYGFTYMFYLDKTNLSTYKPEFIIRGSIYLSVLKLRGYEDWGYLTLEAFRAVRSEPYNSLIIADHINSRPFYRNLDSVFRLNIIDSLIPSYIDNDSADYGGESSFAILAELPYVGIIENSIRREVKLFSEMNKAFDDEYMSSMRLTILTDSFVYNDASFPIASVDSYVYSTVVLSDFIANSAIIPTIPDRFLENFNSKEIYFEITQGV
jgi:hypothetical protein